MHFSPLALVLSLTLASGTPALQGRADSDINPYSTHLMLQAEKSQKEGHLVEAEQLLESALAVDPRNKNAFIALGRVAAAQDLTGKAIRFYRSALTIDPTDTTALEAQGEAMVTKGAMNRAQQNLTKIKEICKTECPAYNALAAVIAKGPPATSQVKTADSHTANDNSATVASNTPKNTSSSEATSKAPNNSQNIIK